MTEKEIRIIQSNFISDIQKYLPQAKFSMSSQFGGEREDSYGDLRLELSFSQNVLENTTYGIGDTKQFIHYTSFDAFFSILNDQSIRLNDLNQLNDPREFDFLIKEYGIEIEKDEIELFKRSLFLFSMCEYNNTDGDDFNMWRMYGRDGKGVGIVFEIENPEKNWHGFLLGKVNYDNESSEKELCGLVSLVKEYRKRGLNFSRMPFLVGSLLLFHKSRVWALEKEVRLLTFHEYDVHTFQSGRLLGSPHFGTEKITHFLNNSGIKSAYVSINMNDKILAKAERIPVEEDRNKVLKVFPRLQIKKVIVGYNVDLKYLDEFNVFLIQYIKFMQKIYIPVEYSKYRKLFES